jgi:UDP-glucose:(heptosyl)LPS alpha-1,3-glucosyltransferase
MRRRIAIIIERADVALGGAERSMSEVAAALSEAGWDVDLLAAKGTKGAPNVCILCPDAPGTRVSLAVFEKALKQHLARTAYDIVHSVLPFDLADVYQPRGGTYAEALLRHVASYRNRLQRWYKRATAFTNLRRGQLLQAERRLCQGPDGPVIAALSGYVADQLRRHYGTDNRRIRLIPNGVATDRHADPQAAERLRLDILRRLALPKQENPLLLLFAAHNFRLKGLEALIRALQLARQKATERPPCLIVVGAGKIAPYRRLAQRLGVAQHIVFLGPSQSVQDVLAISHVAVLPTFYDPSSRFILEALAASKPVITTRFNGATDHFVDGRHGRVVETPENTQALAEAIAHFTTSENITRATQAILADSLKEKISVRRVAGELDRLYQSLLDEKRRL